MKTVDAGQFAANISQFLHESLSEAIVVTKAGKPCAILHGLDYDDEQSSLVNSAEFWEMIQQRRERPTTQWDAAKQQLDPTGK